MLLDTAGIAFREKGFGGCSIDHIARESGVSKSTIYRHFKNKEAIFEAVNQRIADQQAALVADFKLDVSEPLNSLRSFAHHVYAIDTQPLFLEAFRLLIAEAARLPKMTERVRERGVSTVLNMLTEYFQQLLDKNIIQHPDARQAAITFYVLARGNFRPLLGASVELSEEQSKIDIDINLFLKGVGLLSPS